MTTHVDAMPVPYGRCLLLGLGGLFAGVTGPLLSTFVPLLVRDVLGDQRAAIGAVMAIDNVLLLLLVPWTGAASDRARAFTRWAIDDPLFRMIPNRSSVCILIQARVRLKPGRSPGQLAARPERPATTASPYAPPRLPCGRGAKLA